MAFDRFPFDREEPVRSLGPTLLTRLKVEHEQQVVREFLSQRQ
jgi:hypothetical protein